jgi:hypothetical protein
MSRRAAFGRLLALALTFVCVMSWASTNICLPVWTVEHGVNSSGRLALDTNQSETILQLN